MNENSYIATDHATCEKCGYVAEVACGDTQPWLEVNWSEVLRKWLCFNCYKRGMNQ